MIKKISPNLVCFILLLILSVRLGFCDINIKYLGHSCFYINLKEKDSIHSILIDPYSHELQYPFLKQFQKTNNFKNLNYIISTHNHFDHFNQNIFKLLKNKYIIGADDNNWYPFYLENKKVKIYNFGVYHDETLGKERGKNSIIVIQVKLNTKDFKLVHLGDIGHLLEEKTNYINKKNLNIKEIKNCDILFVPIGGYFTIDINKINELIDFINPKVIIPMHYKNKYISDFPILTLNEFLNTSNIKEKLKNFKIIKVQDLITINKISEKQIIIFNIY